MLKRHEIIFLGIGMFFVAPYILFIVYVFLKTGHLSSFDPLENVVVFCNEIIVNKQLDPFCIIFGRGMLMRSLFFVLLIGSLMVSIVLIIWVYRISNLFSKIKKIFKIFWQSKNYIITFLRMILLVLLMIVILSETRLVPFPWVPHIFEFHEVVLIDNTPQCGDEYFNKISSELQKLRHCEVVSDCTLLPPSSYWCYVSYSRYVNKDETSKYNELVNACRFKTNPPPCLDWGFGVTGEYVPLYACVNNTCEDGAKFEK